jgi:hypothetical protein
MTSLESRIKRLEGSRTKAGPEWIVLYPGDVMPDEVRPGSTIIDHREAPDPAPKGCKHFCFDPEDVGL